MTQNHAHTDLPQGQPDPLAGKPHYTELDVDHPTHDRYRNPAWTGMPAAGDYSNPMPDGDMPQGRYPLLQLLRTLWNNKWHILAVAVLGGILTGYLGSLRPSLYEAKAQLLISSPVSGTVPGTSLPSQEAINEMIDGNLTMLTTQSQLRRVVETLRANHNEDALAAINAIRGRSGFLSLIKSSLRRWAGHAPTMPENADAGAPQIADDKDAELIENLRDGLRVGQELRSRVISVGFMDTSRQTATLIANTAAQTYVDQQTAKSRKYYEGQLAEIDGRVPQVQNELSQAIEKKEYYRIENGLNDQDSAADAATEIVQLRQLLDDAGAKLAAAKAASQGGSGLAGQRVAFLETTKKSLEDRLALLEAKAADDSRRMSGLRSLELEIDAAAGRYNDILGKRDALRQRVKDPDPGVTLLSAAWSPTEPVTLPWPFLIPPGLVLFGLFGAIYALIRQSMDTSVHTESEATAALGIGSIGMLPALKKSSAHELSSQLVDGQYSPYRRGVSAILYSILPERENAALGTIVLATSSNQHEGKTHLAWTLAATAARAGLNTLFVDLDPNEDPMTRVLRESARAAGKEHIEAGRDIMVVSRIDKLGLDFIPGSAGLLANGAMKNASRQLDALRQNYEFVVLHGPAVAEAPEVRSFADVADIVLFAVAWGKTPRSLARAAIRQIGGDDVNTDTIKLVLTKVNVKQQSQFGGTGGAEMLKAYAET